MINLTLPDKRERPLAFYLAMEEWAARCLPAGEYFFAWRVAPTVICGRNQCIADEVNLEYCRSKGIDVVRRRSGGGCVYADRDNWMFSYITPGDEVMTTFSHYTDMIVDMLRALGFDARSTGRNDICIGNHKVAGNAFYHVPGRAIVHGTMLCKIDAETMSRAITPSKAKLESKAVRSVPSRVTSLTREGLGMTVAEFGDYAVKALCGTDIRVLLPDEIKLIEELEQRYYRPEWFNDRPRHTEAVRKVRRVRRIEGLGEFDITVSLDKEGNIDAIAVSGDYFSPVDLSNYLTSHFKGTAYTRDGLSRKLSSVGGVKADSGIDESIILELLID